ncbi:hypothetical protein TWF694_007362 [Orbilia ellipsospora]|uniref:CorA-like transporter domain-containing protein n=1 Tax=Orbilia ellipsospora TaxID=2528407 RepID=A0AAV9XJ01_9PEZI
MNSEIEYVYSDSLGKWSIYPVNCFDDERLVSEAEMKDYSETLNRAAVDYLCAREGDRDNTRLRVWFFRPRRIPRELPAGYDSTANVANNAELEQVVDDGFKESIIKSPSELDFHLAEVNGWKSQQTVTYYFDSKNSWSRLLVPEEIIRKIFANYLIKPKLLSILITFGEKIKTTEESLLSYFDNIQELNPFRTMHSGDASAYTYGELNGYEIGYNIKYVARHNRTLPKDPFVVRQTGVYQKFNPQDKRTIWVLIHAASGLKERLKSIFAKFNQRPRDFALQLEIHLTILTYCGDNWRPYITYLENFAEDLIDRGFYSQAIEQPGIGSLQAETSDVRELHFLSDKLRRLVQLVDLDIHLGYKFLQFVRRLIVAWSRTEAEPNPRLNELVVGVEDYLLGLEVSKSRIVSLFDRVKEILTLVRQVLDFRNEESNRNISLNLKTLVAASVEENMHMRYIAEKGAKDTKLVKIITIITAVFFPATFVAVSWIHFIVTIFKGREK